MERITLNPPETLLAIAAELDKLRAKKKWWQRHHPAELGMCHALRLIATITQEKLAAELLKTS